MKNFLKQNWFKLGVFLILLYGVVNFTQNKSSDVVSNIPVSNKSNNPDHVAVVAKNEEPLSIQDTPVIYPSVPPVIKRTPSKKIPTWHTAFTYTGESSTRTKEFYLHESWRVTVTCKPLGDLAGVSVGIFGGPSFESEQFGGGSDCPENRVYNFSNHTSGNYTLDTNGSYNASYTIKIEDFY